MIILSQASKRNAKLKNIFGVPNLQEIIMEESHQAEDMKLKSELLRSEKLMQWFGVHSKHEKIESKSSPSLKISKSVHELLLSDSPEVSHVLK